MSSSLLLQQCPAWMVRLTCIVFVTGGRWPYNWCLVGVLLPGLIHLLSINYDYILVVKLATVVEGDSKAPFSIATSLRCRRGCYSFPWIAPLYS